MDVLQWIILGKDERLATIVTKNSNLFSKKFFFVVVHADKIFTEPCCFQLFMHTFRDGLAHFLKMEAVILV